MKMTHGLPGPGSVVGDHPKRLQPELLGDGAAQALKVSQQRLVRVRRRRKALEMLAGNDEDVGGRFRSYILKSDRVFVF